MHLVADLLLGCTVYGVRGRAVRRKGDSIASPLGLAHRPIDAKLRLHAAEDDVMHTEARKDLLEVGFAKRIPIAFLDDCVARTRCDLPGDLPPSGVRHELIIGVTDVDDGRTRC